MPRSVIALGGALGLALGIALIIAVSTSPACAGPVLIRQSLAGSVGGSVPMAPQQFTDLWAPGYGLAGSIRLRIVPRFHVNLEVAYYRHLSNKSAFRDLLDAQQPNVTLAGYDQWVIPVSLVAEIDLFRRGNTKPYAILGGGWYTFGTTDAAVSGLGADQVVLPDVDDSAFGLQFGLGVRTPIALGVTLFVDVNYHMSFTQDDTRAFLPIRLGVQF